MFEGDRARWGWHRLESDYADELVRSSGIGPSSLVLDVGAGTGSLTAPLVATGARVIAVELHEGRFARLQEQYKYDPRVKLLRIDARSLLFPRQPFSVVANPPFSITSHLVHRLLARDSKLLSAHIVMQRAAARRFAVGRAIPIGKSTHYFELGVERLLPRSAFCPQPRVDIAVLSIRRVDLKSHGPRRRRNH